MRTKLLLIVFGIMAGGFSVEISLWLYNCYEERLPQNQHGAFHYIWSEHGLQSIENGGVTGVPNKSVRQRSMLSDQADFDVTVPINNLGLFDHRDYHVDRTANKRIAIVGDSFTQGVGAEPWVGKMAEELEKKYKVQIFNLGIMGTGFRNFQLLLEHFHETLQFTDVVIVAIEDDFARGHFYPIACGDRVWFCEEGQARDSCLSKETRFKLTTPVWPCKMPAKDVTPITMQSERFPARNWYTSLLRPIIRSSHLLTFLNARRQDWIAYRKSHYTDNLPVRFEDNLSHLRGIVRRYTKARVGVVRLPDRNETIRGYYLSDSKKYVQAEVGYYADLWEHCPITIDMFHKWDHHFNSDGYSKIAECLKKHLLIPLIESEVSTPQDPALAVQQERG